MHCSVQSVHLKSGATRKLKLNCQPGGYNRRSFIPGQVDHFFQAAHDVENVTGIQFYFKDLPNDFKWKIRKLIIKKEIGYLRQHDIFSPVGSRDSIYNH